MKKVIIFVFLIFLKADEIYLFFTDAKINYKEYINSYVIDKEDSNFNDINGFKFRYVKNLGKFIFIPEISYLRGNTIYNGFNQNLNSISFKEYGVYIKKIKADIGYKINKNLYGLIGLGVRIYNRGKGNLKGDYNEKYNFKFYELGFLVKKIIKKIKIGIRFLYHKAFYSKLKVFLQNNPIYNLYNTKGFDFEIPVEYKISKNISFLIEYDYEYWKSEKSNIVFINNIPTFEPNNETKNEYLNIGIKYQF